VVVACALSGCFNPGLPADLQCADGLCPPGFVCDDGTCRRTLTDASAPDAAPEVDAAIDAQVCGTATFRQGDGDYTSAADTTLREANPNLPLGNLDTVEWDGDDAGSGDVDIALIRFDDVFGDEAGQVPPGAKIQSASLEVVVIDASDPPAGTVHQVLIPWDEATTFNSFGDEPGPDAGDIGAPLLEAPVDLGPASLDVTAAVAASSQGWAFVAADGNPNGAQLASSEANENLLRPRLVVEFCH
jgi:hypothetical protein